MFLRLKNLILAPRLWLSAGVFCLSVSIVIGYHEDQLIAETTLAQKISLPEKVKVQDFSSDRHENALSEVSILVEAAIDRMVRIDVGNEVTQKLADVVPVYPVSRQAFPVADSLLIPRRRPVARKDAASIAALGERLANVENIPVGLLIFETDTSAGAMSLEHLHIAEGTNGPLIDITGVLIGGATILERAESPLAEKGVQLISGAIVVSPYLEGRASVGTIADYSGLRETLFWLSFGMFLIGSATVFSIVPAFERKKTGQHAHRVKAVGTFPAIDPFQPIADQDDIG